MHHAVRARSGWVAAFVLALAFAGGAASAQRGAQVPPVAPPHGAPAAGATSEAALPAGDGAAVLRATLATMVDVGADAEALMQFVDHGAVRAGGGSPPFWWGRMVEIGIGEFLQPADSEALEAATGLSLAEVATTLVVTTWADNVATLVRGGVDAARLDAALTARGYVAVDGDVGRRWCGKNGCDTGLDIDLETRDDLTALFGGDFGRSFPVAVVDDLLVAGPVPDVIDAVIEAAAGRVPSLLDRPEVAALVDALDVDAVVRQVWWPLGSTTVGIAPPGARSILFADARRGDDEWLLVLAAFDRPAAADAFAAGALEALGLRGDTAFGPATLQTALRTWAAEAAVDVVAHHGLQVVRLVVARPFADGVGTVEDRPAALLNALLNGVMRFELPWVVR